MARSKGKAPAARQSAINKAKGQTYSGPSTTDGKITHIKGKIEPQQFHGQYVKARMPVVLHGQLDDLKFATENWSNVEFLRKTGGGAPVKVEPMHKEKRRYGTDVERVDTSFGEFLDSLAETKHEYDYLTTQYSDDEDEDDEDDDDDDNDDKEIKKGTFPEPVRTLLSKDVPMRPSLMGNLVLQQMNLWLGKSKAGASSGLHHDFHDNLYVLLKGRKRFVLYPPSAVHHLNTYGQPRKIHLNGLIVYRQPGEEDGDDEEDTEGDEIRADGLVQREAATLKVEALERRVDSMKESGKKKGLEKLEKELEEAVDQMLKYQLGGLEGMDDDSDDEEDDDEGDEDEELKDQVLRDDAGGKKRKAEQRLDGHAIKAAKFDEDEESSDEEDGLAFGAAEDDDDGSDADLMEALENAKNGQGPSEPLSFSQIPTQELHQHLGLISRAKSSPALKAAGTPYIVDLKAGDMLYLPTSWFHEVTSFSDEDDDVHIALNYWFHPPDSALQKFDHPYEDITLWNYMGEKVKKAYESVIAENAEKK